MARLIKTELFNFKNVEHGIIEHMNYSSVKSKAEIENSDILGIYGQNGSGKTAVVEALDVVKRIMQGKRLNFSEDGGLLRDDGTTKIVNAFFFKVNINGNLKKYWVEYEVSIKSNLNNKSVDFVDEKISVSLRGKNWRKPKYVAFSNPYYANELDVLESEQIASLDNSNITQFSNLFVDKLAIACQRDNVSFFFNNNTVKYLDKNIKKKDEYVTSILVALRELKKFACGYFHVIKVCQLSDINGDVLVPINIHKETDGIVEQGCLPLLTNNTVKILPKAVFDELSSVIPTINIALKALIPNMKIEIDNVEELATEEGKKVSFSVYSVRGNTKVLIMYESEGIKRIISLLHYLISVYNNPEICLVVDEMDSGIFEFLLGELIGVLYQSAKGQLIFTSHNLRALEMLGNRNIICSTTKSKNRYIRLKGIARNNNRRDFYLRAVLLGGQEESLYDNVDLVAIENAFTKANGDIDKRGNDRMTNDIENFFKKMNIKK